MKRFQMTIFLLVLTFAYIAGPCASMKLNNEIKQVKNIVIDNGQSNLALQQVVRRNPTVTIGHSTLPSKRIESSSVSFGNSNSHNGPTDMGKTAAIINPTIMLHGHSTISAIKETPAHVGWREKKKTITSLNKDSGKVEQHVIDSKIPLVGMIQEVKALNVHHTRKYDINSNTLGPVTSSVNE